MHTFLLISMPAIMIWAIITNPEYRWTSFVPPALTGLIIAIITCAIKEFFIFYSHIATTNSFAHFLYLAARDSIIPMTVLFLIFMILSKDERNYIIESIVPLSLSFFSAYIPYFILRGKEPQSMFLSVIKPLLFISLSFLASAAVKCMHSYIKNNNKPFIALAAFATIICLILPSMIETIWYYNINRIIWLLLSIIYISAAFCFTLKSRIQYKS
ncbi:MAG: hypothetical protein K6G00_12255 [Treponema sp.]|nr:hypothetical protein [Treponema sp.]